MRDIELAIAARGGGIPYATRKSALKLFALFKRQKPTALVKAHPEFGEITYSRHDGWMSRTFSFWGFENLELLVAGDEGGPTETQLAAFRRLHDSRATIYPRCINALSVMRSEMHKPPGQWVISGLTIPPLDTSPSGTLWTMWFDSKDDDHYLYGIQTDDDWSTLAAFADD